MRATRSPDLSFRSRFNAGFKTLLVLVFFASVFAPDALLAQQDQGQTTVREAEFGPAPKIQALDKHQFLRELSLLGTSRSIADREFIFSLIGWYPTLQDAVGQLRATMDPKLQTERLSGASLVYLPGGMAEEKGRFTLYLHAPTYCIRLSDAEAVFGKVDYVYEPRHTTPPWPRIFPVYGAVFKMDERSRVVLTFQFQECAQSMHVLKNLGE